MLIDWFISAFLTCLFLTLQVDAEGSKLQEKLDYFCQEYLPTRDEGCEDRPYARLDGDQWRCFKGVKSDQSSLACVDNSGGLVRCSKPDLAGKQYCTKDSNLRGMIDSAATSSLQVILDNYCLNQVSVSRKDCKKVQFARLDGKTWRCFEYVDTEASLKYSCADDRGLDVKCMPGYTKEWKGSYRYCSMDEDIRNLKGKLVLKECRKEETPVEEIEGPSLQDNLDEYCLKENCNGNFFARYGLDKEEATAEWRCYQSLDMTKMSESCIADRPHTARDLKYCGGEPVSDKGNYCNKDKEITSIINQELVQSPCEYNICVSQEGCPLKKGTLLTTLPYLNQDFFISFEFKITDYQSGYQNLLHFTNNGNNDGWGSRIPGVWIKDSGHLYVCFSISGNGNKCQPKETKQYEKDKWHSVQIYQRLKECKVPFTVVFTVVVDGLIVMEEDNVIPDTFNNVKVYGADSWHKPMKGSIRNLIINKDTSKICTELDPGIASMSSEYSDKYSAAKCIDGDLDTYCYNQKGGDENPFFMIEYKEPKKVYQVRLIIKPGKEEYAKGIQVFVSVDCQNSIGKGKDYTGSVSKTKSGKTCKHWSSTKKSSVGDHNQCRNPDGEDGVWCYTTDPNTRWELCDVPFCTEDSSEDTGIASMSSEYSETYSAAKCIDGDLDTYCYNKKGGDEKPFFMIEYKEPKKVYQVRLIIKPGKEKYATYIRVYVTNDPSLTSSGTQIGSTFTGPAKEDQVIDFISETGVEGKYVIVKQEKGTITFAEVQVNPDTDGFDCQGGVNSYSGLVSKTNTGKTCKNWPSYFNIGTSHYCRNPNNDPQGVWCCIDDACNRLELCDVPFCKEVTTSSVVTTTAATTDPDGFDLNSCQDGVNPNSYSGTVSKTESGETCKSWADAYPGANVPSGSQNYCRNPNRDEKGVWCCTNPDCDEPGYCHVPHCKDVTTSSVATTTAATTDPDVTTSSAVTTTAATTDPEDTGIASMSSEYSDAYSAAKCMDGDLDTYCYNQKGGDENPFFMIEYKEPKKVYLVRLIIKPEYVKSARDIQVFVTNDPAKKKGKQIDTTFYGPPRPYSAIDFKSETGLEGKYVIVKQRKGTMTFIEVLVNSDSEYEYKEDGVGCGDMKIETPEECAKAAVQLGFQTKLESDSVGSWTSSPENCMVKYSEFHRYWFKLYFNQSPTPVSQRSGYRSICHKAVDGGWSSWNACTESCEGGIQYRRCDSPPPNSRGNPCSGEPSRACNEGVTCTASEPTPTTTISTVTTDAITGSPDTAKPSLSDGFMNYAILENVARCSVPYSVKSSSECAKAAGALGYSGDVQIRSKAELPQGCGVNTSKGEIFFNNHAGASASSNNIVICERAYPAVECKGSQATQNILLGGPGNLIEISSPNYPNSYSTSSRLSCQWRFQAQYSANVTIKVVESSWKNCNPADNNLRIHDDSYDGNLAFPGLKATCAPTDFPKTGDSVTDNEKLMVEFWSGSANQDDISFKLIVESTGATISPPKESTNKCPEGPCCSGVDCCVYELGTNPTEINSPGYPEISGKDLQCTYKLRTVEGSRIAFNFLEMDMLDSVNCNKDYVQLKDNGATHSFIGSSGKSFCGRQLPNSPGPSVLVSDDNQLTIVYRTEKNVEERRGRGFKALASAVNPYLEPMTYTHTYGKHTCSSTCGETTPLEPLLEPHCTDIPLTITVMDNTTSTPITHAKISVSSVQTSTLSPSISFVAHSTVDGKIHKNLESNTNYQITVTMDGYEAQTEGLNSDCSNSDCEACAKDITVNLVPVTEPGCPEGMTGEIQVIDKASKKPISGANVNVIENGNNPVVTGVETNVEGIVTLPLLTNGSYSINVTKEGYESILLEEVEDNCTLSIVAELPQPVCHTDNIIITLNVHVKDEETDDGIEGASVNVYENGNTDSINEAPLIADTNGKVALTVPDAGYYKVEVQAEGMDSKQKGFDVFCDKTECKNCSTLAVLDLDKMEEPECIDTNLTVQTMHVTTGSAVDARVTIKYTPDNYSWMTIIVAENSQVGANGNTSIPIDGNGEYVVSAIAEGYINNTKTITVNCITDDCAACNPSIQIQLVEEVCNEIEFKIIVTDELTDNPISSAKVVAKLVTETGTEVVTHNNKDYMLTDEDGILEVPIVEEAKYTLEITKEGFEPYNGNKTIDCFDEEHGTVCPCSHELSVQLNQVVCNQEIIMDIKITNESNIGVGNASIILKLTNSVAGPSNTNVGGTLITNSTGDVSLHLETAGTYEITVEADGYLDRTIVDVEKDTECMNEDRASEYVHRIVVPINITIKKQPEEYCQDVPFTVTIVDKHTKTPIPSAAVDITFGEYNFITPNTPVADGVLTDQFGKTEVSVSQKGTFDISVVKEGYLPSNGTGTVDCDIDDCESCSLSVTLEVDQPRCPDVSLPVTITDQDSGKPIESATVTLTLTNSLSGPSLLLIGSPRYTNETGITTFDVQMNGNYSFNFEADTYDTKNLPLSIDCNPVHCKGCVPLVKTTLKKEFCQDKTFEFIVRNSITNEPVTGATVRITKTVEEYGPTEVASLTVPSTGIVDVPIDGNGIYSAYISLTGYETFKTTFEVDITLAECPLLDPIELQPVSPTLPCDDGIRISLSWGQNPMDMDLYSNQVNKNDNTDECLTYYCDGKDNCTGSTFDVDNKEGGFNGSETITFCDNDDYVQMVYVDDLSGKGSSLLSSDAKLVITSKTETKVIHLDPSYANAPARYWLAGCLTMENGAFDWIEVNEFLSRKPDSEEPLHCYNRNALKEANQNQEKYQYLMSLAAGPVSEEEAEVLVKVSADHESLTTSFSSKNLANFDVQQQGLYTVDITSSGYIPVREIVMVQSSNTEEKPAKRYFQLLPDSAPNSINLLLHWPADKERDLDLFSFKVNTANSLLTCKTYFNNKDGCKDVLLIQNSKNGTFKFGETITVSNADASSGDTFLIYAQDKTLGGSAIETSGAELTVTDGKKIIVESTPNPTLTKVTFWLIGCLQTADVGFNFVTLETYTREDPTKTADKLKCHELFKTYTPPPTEQFCKETTLNVEVRDSLTNAAVPNATIAMKVDGPTFSQIVPTVGKKNPIKMNGEYLISTNAPGYVSKMDSITVKCDLSDCGNCNPSLSVSLSPVLTHPEFLLTLTWNQGIQDLNMFVVQRDPIDYTFSCTISADAEYGCDQATITTGENIQTVTFNSIYNARMVYMIYIKDEDCDNPQDFLSSRPKLSITDGKLTTELELNEALYKNNKYWVAGCVEQVGDPNPIKSPYRFSPINIFLNQQPDIEVPDQCLFQLGFDVPTPIAKEWPILKPSSWFG